MYNNIKGKWCRRLFLFAVFTVVFMISTIGLGDASPRISQVIINGTQYDGGEVDLGPVQNLNLSWGFRVNTSLEHNLRARIVLGDPQSGNPEKTIDITGNSVDFGVIPLSTSNTMYPVTMVLLDQDNPVDQASFTLRVGVIDTTAPQVESVTPTNSSFQIQIDPVVTITLNELVQENTVTHNTVILKAPNGGKVNAIVNANTVGSQTVITLTPTSVLQYSTGYTIEVVEGGIKDLAGNGIKKFSSSFTTIPNPDASPVIVERTPLGNSKNISITTGIDITLSKELNLSTITANNLYLSKGTSKIPTTAIVRNINGQGRITLTPASNLDYNTAYTVVVVNNGIKDINGKGLAGTTWSFTTESNPNTIIISRYPGENNTNIPVDSPITLRFSAPLNSGTVTNSTIYLRRSGSTTNISATVTYNNTNRTVTLTPNSPLQQGTVYQIYVTGQVKDSSGQSLTATTWQFTTESNPLRIVSRIPSVNETRVPIQGEIRVQFSVPMRTATLNSNTVYLRHSGTSANIPVTINYNSNDRTMIVTPVSSLQYGRTYTLFLTSGIEDSNRNSLSSTNWNFTTVEENDTRIISRSPGINGSQVPVNQPVTIVFSKGMTNSTINNNNIYLSPSGYSSRVAASVSYDHSSRTVTLTPSSPLQYNTEYTVYITEGVRDSQGNSLSLITWRFTTNALAQPTIMSSEPLNNQTGIPVDQVMSLRFNRPLDRSTVNTSNVYLQKQGTRLNHPVVVNTTQNHTTITVTALGNLDYNTNYTLYLTGLKDTDGNIVPITTLSFVTKRDTERRGTPQSPLVKVNGQYVQFTDAKPYIKNDRIFIPFRALVETFGAQVGHHNPYPQPVQVWAILSSNKVDLTIGNNRAYKNGSLLMMDVAPEIVNNRTMIPLRFAMEALDKKVRWDESTYTAILED